MEDMISVVVTTYHQEKTIARTLDSILCQKCHLPIEIVIGEDASSDGTRTICQDYATRFPQIRLFCNTHNKGIPDNYIDCLLNCRGRYIADCAGDDFWVDPLKLEKEVTLMEQHPEVSMIITNWNFYNEVTQQVTPGHQKQLAPITPGHQLLEAFITQTGMSVFHLCTSLYRADIFRSCYQADPALFRHYVTEDLQIACAMAQHGDIAYLPDVTLHYSIGNESVSAQKDDARQFRFLRNVTQLSFDLAKRFQLKSPKVDAFFSQRLFELGMHALRAHDTALFKEMQAYVKKWQPQRTAKIRLLYAVMRHAGLWRIALIARKVFVSLKQVRR